MVKSDQHTDGTTAEVPADIRTRLAIENAPAWRPEAGDMFTGKVVKLGVFEHDVYGKSPVVTYSVNGGYLKVYAIHQTLAARFYDLKPSIGDENTLAYFGVVKSNSRTDAKTGEPIEYHKYSVIGGTEQEEETPW
jgi:hypothetical protein